MQSKSILLQVYKIWNSSPVPDHSFVKEVLPILSAGVVVLTFIIDRIISHRVRNREARRTWYFKAHFEPAIKKIDIFFDEVIKVVDPAIKKVSSDLKKNIDVQAYVSAQLESVADSKRRFAADILTPIQYTYSELFQECENILNEFEDQATIALAEEAEEHARINDFYSSIAIRKAKLLLALSQPVLGMIKKRRMIELWERFRNNSFQKETKKRN